ncbi:MAG: Nramp family divalent metal transporter [Planctomycetales bacterium]
MESSPSVSATDEPVPNTDEPVPHTDELVPDDVIPHRLLPPLRYRDMPEAPAWTKLVGPSVMLAGLALGSGEFIFWPYLTYKSGFVFFWACMLGVITQFFINMEIERWTLVTGETAVTGFSRLSRHWAWVMLILNIVPWIWPGWATGAGTLICWLFLGPSPVPIDIRHPMPPSGQDIQIPMTLNEKVRIQGTGLGALFVWSGPMTGDQQKSLSDLSSDRAFKRAVYVLGLKVGEQGGYRYETPLAPYFAIASLLLIGVVLTTGPVIYNTVEKLQFWLVSTIFVIAFVLGVQIIRLDAVGAMIKGAVNFGGFPPDETGIEIMALLGAVAFAGAGGTMNLGQSNFIRDKGYGMGKYVGRITSPLTGQAEPVADVGFHFPHTPENQRRFKAWWKAANYEHFFSFFLTCVVCLMLLSLISYSLFYTSKGKLLSGLPNFGTGMNFVWGEALLIERLYPNSVAGGAVSRLVPGHGNQPAVDDGAGGSGRERPDLGGHRESQLPP